MNNLVNLAEQQSVDNDIGAANTSANVKPKVSGKDVAKKFDSENSIGGDSNLNTQSPAPLLNGKMLSGA